MEVGMLWFDNDASLDLATRVDRAAQYYAGKYGNNPNLCFIHPSMIMEDGRNDSGEQKITAGQVEVRLTKSVLPHHFWIGTQVQN
jgi:hypothetical protein